MSKLHKTLVMVLVVCALAISVSAAPQLIDYQGYLEDDNGNPITDTLSISFDIGGHALGQPQAQGAGTQNPY